MRLHDIEERMQKERLVKLQGMGGETHGVLAKRCKAMLRKKLEILLSKDGVEDGDPIPCLRKRLLCSADSLSEWKIDILCSSHRKLR